MRVFAFAIVAVGLLLLTQVGCLLWSQDSGLLAQSEETNTSGMPAPVKATADAPTQSALLPELHKSFRDPTFGTLITRVTDPSMASSTAAHRVLGLRHEYSRFPALNADNTKIVVRVLGGAERGRFEIRDLAKGTLLYHIKPVRGDPEMSWHPTDPHLLFYRAGNEICVFHADSGRVETRMRFPQYSQISTKGEGRPSDDWRYYAFLGIPQSGDRVDIVVADLEQKRIIATWANSGKPDWVSMSPSGKYVVVQWTDGKGTRLYDPATLQYLHTAFSDKAHSDFAFDADGNEVIVYHVTSRGQLEELGFPSGSPIAKARLRDGKKTKLLDLGWNWFTPHFSGIASRRRPGWVLVSTYTTPENPQQPYAREVFWLKLDGSGEVRHVAQHRSDQRRTGGKKDYWAEPQATSSWDGTIVLFSSVWGRPFTEYNLYTVTGQWWTEKGRENRERKRQLSSSSIASPQYADGVHPAPQ